MKSSPPLVACKSIPEGLIVRNTRRMLFGRVRCSPLYEYVTYVDPSNLVYLSPCPYDVIRARNNKQSVATVNILRGCPFQTSNPVLFCSSNQH